MTTPEPNLNPPAENSAMAYCPTRKMRLRAKLFPRRYCDHPHIEGKLIKDGIHTCTAVRLSWLDRFRILLTGRASITTKTTLFDGGAAATNSAFQVEPWLWLCDADDREVFEGLAARQKGAAQ